MAEELSDEELDRLIADLIGAKRQPTREPIAPSVRRRARRRGRPATGFTNALKYADRYWELRQQGISPWHAKTAVAEECRKNVRHISACVKTINETDPYEYLFEIDRTEDV